MNVAFMKRKFEWSWFDGELHSSRESIRVTRNCNFSWLMNFKTKYNGLWTKVMMSDMMWDGVSELPIVTTRNCSVNIMYISNRNGCLPLGRLIVYWEKKKRRNQEKQIVSKYTTGLANAGYPRLVIVLWFGKLKGLIWCYRCKCSYENLSRKSY